MNNVLTPNHPYLQVHVFSFVILCCSSTFFISDFTGLCYARAEQYYTTPTATTAA